MKRLFLTFVTILFATAAMAQTNLAVPAGTALRVKLDRMLTTFSNKAGDQFTGHLSQAVILDGRTIVPLGAMVEGKVTKVSEPRRIKGKATIGILPQTVVLPGGERYPLDATLVDTNLRDGSDVNEEGQFKGRAHGRNDLAELGAGVGGGMIAGGLIGAVPGALIGGGVGATASTVHYLARHQSTMIPSGTELILELNRPLLMNSTSSGQ
jgi:hypothetical protein